MLTYVTKCQRQNTQRTRGKAGYKPCSKNYCQTVYRNRKEPFTIKFKSLKAMKSKGKKNQTEPSKTQSR